MDTSLDHWIQEFVQDHGLGKVTQVLRAYQLGEAHCSVSTCGWASNGSTTPPSMD